MTAIELPTELAAAAGRVAASVVHPGPGLDGAERRAVATVARSGLAHRTATTVLEHVAAVISTDAHTARGSWVEGLGEHGVDGLRYLEIVGIVARVRAIDTLCFALGLPPVELPAAGGGEPTRRYDERATIDGGFVPTVGRAGAPNALSALPSEMNAMHELHAALYLSMEQMRDLDVRRGLHRSQMELVAARTSWLNECFY